MSKRMQNPSPFKPAWWLPHPHLQTLWPALCRRFTQSLPLVQERLELPDGDFIDLHWLGEKNKPIVIILHGLEGNIHSHYAKGILHHIQQQGWRGVFMHFRGCSGEPNRLPRSYHSGETGDLNQVVKTLQEREPHTPLAAMGFSLGGNVLLKWLGETGKNNPLRAAIAVSTPFELKKAVTRMNQGFSRLYQWHLVSCLRKRLTRQFQQQPHTIETLTTCRTLQAIDDYLTAPLHGFKDAEDYYTQSSSRPFLKAIRVPTLLLNAKDDPFMTEDVIPQPEELSSYVQLEVSDTGGHVGFVEGTFPWRATYWIERRASLFLREALAHV